MFQTRSYELEFIDTGDYTPEEYDCCLKELRLINRYAGDIWALNNSLLKEIKQQNLREFSVLDVGAGSGEFLRVMADFARKEKREAKLFGVELNELSANSMRHESSAYSEISAIRANVFSLPFADNSFDYVICSLFTHHFKDEPVVEILREFNRVSKRKFFVIDLHRHRIAYFLYTTIGKIFLKSRLTRHDGALSILRGFKPNEFNQLALEAELAEFKVKRHFPFRLVLESRK